MQKIVGTFLYYGIAVDNTILVALITISSEQSSATSNTAKKITQLLNYFATHPDATIRYNAVTWSYGSTVMPPTCPAQNHEADQGACIF